MVVNFSLAISLRGLLHLRMVKSAFKQPEPGDKGHYANATNGLVRIADARLPSCALSYQVTCACSYFACSFSYTPASHASTLHAPASHAPARDALSVHAPYLHAPRVYAPALHAPAPMLTAKYGRYSRHAVPWSGFACSRLACACNTFSCSIICAAFQSVKQYPFSQIFKALFHSIEILVQHVTLT
jgi:hypothetical protein